MSQPTAIRPWIVSSSLRSMSARRTTTVLAIDSARPSTTAPPMLQPIVSPRPVPSSVTTMIWPNAPGTAMALTARRSRIEKWIPTPNMSRITPISASSDARLASAMNPGVKGPTATPATR